MRWSLGYKRGPDCGARGTFGREQDEEDYWGNNDLFEECCSEKMDCFNDEDCRDKCTNLNDNKQRFIGPDVGYVLDWQIDDEGLPKGCKAFQNVNGTDKSEEVFTNRQKLTKRNKDVECPKQMMSDGEGGIMHETVQFFADNLKDWHEAFISAFLKMQNNGYGQDELKTNDLTGFWKHSE